MVDKLIGELSTQFIDNDEPVMICEKFKKLKTYGESDNEERIYVMTFERIYAFKNKKRSRLYLIKDVNAIISSNENEKDFTLFFERSDDLHCSISNRSDVLSLLKLRFNNINRNITLRHFAVSDSMLRQYHINNNQKNKLAGIIDLPEDSSRLIAEEIKGEEEFNEELRQRKG